MALQFINRETAQHEDAVLQAEEDRQASLAAQSDAWKRVVCERIGVSMEIARPQRIVIDVDMALLQPTVTIICQPNVQLEDLISAKAIGADAVGKVE